MSAIPLIDAVAVIGFLSAAVLAVRLRSPLLDRPARAFLVVGLTIYAIVGLSNLLEHADILATLDQYEDYLEIVFLPFFTFFIYGVARSYEQHQRSRAEAALQAQALLAGKFESLGLMASGIAHDFNNTLTAALGNLELAAQVAASGSRQRAQLDSALQALLQARELTRRLRAFTRTESGSRQPLDLHRLLDGAPLMVRHRHDVEVRAEAPDELPRVLGHEGQLTQVINNLVLNASQALVHGGRIVLRARPLRLPAGSTLPLPAGDYAALEVSDDGPGIPADLLPRVLEPFFTTKDDGSGLGLSVSFATVRNHGGHLWLQSAPGSGTTVHVVLPAAPSDGSVASAPGPAGSALGDG